MHTCACSQVLLDTVSVFKPPSVTVNSASYRSNNSYLAISFVVFSCNITSDSFVEIKLYQIVNYVILCVGFGKARFDSDLSSSQRITEYSTTIFEYKA